jgi:protein-tyrosine phosphatase
MARSYRVLFVCTGNTCRSPMAEQMLRRELAQAGLAVEVASAGLRVAAGGQPADLRAQDVLRAGSDVPDPVAGDHDDFERVLGMLRDAMPCQASSQRSEPGWPPASGG